MLETELTTPPPSENAQPDALDRAGISAGGESTEPRISEADKSAGARDPVEAARLKLFVEGAEQLSIDGAGMSFMDFFKKFGRSPEKMAKLGQLSRPDRAIYFQWEADMKSESEKVDVALDQKRSESEKVDVALDRTNQGIDKASTDIPRLVEKARAMMDDRANAFVDKKVDDVVKDPKGSPLAQDLIARGVVSTEDIASGKARSVLESYIIVGHESQLAPKDEKQKAEFSLILSQMRDSLGVPPTRRNIEILSESKVLGEDREKITNTLYRVSDTGRYDRMYWDKESRSVVFEEKNGDRRIVDTAGIPPTERIVRGGLSLERAAEQVADSPEKTERKRLDKSIDDTTADMSKSPFIAVELGDTGYEKTFDRARYARTSEDKLHLTEGGLRGKRDAIETKVSEFEKSGETREAENLKSAISVIDRELSDIASMREKYTIARQRELNQSGKIGRDDFEEDGYETLKALIDSGYSELGQANLEKLMAGLRAKNGNTGIWEDKQINLDDTIVRTTQLKELRDWAYMMAKNSGKSRKEALQDIRKGIEKDIAFLNIWKNPEALAIWLKRQEGPRDKIKEPPSVS